MRATVTSTAEIEERSATTPFWPRGWWRIVDSRIGIVPVPVFVLLIPLIAGFVATGKVPSDILMAIVLLTVGGFACAEIGKRLPVLRNIGAAAIFATFIPSALVYCQLLPEPLVGLDHRLHQGQQLPLPVHRRDHRRQHPGHGPPGADHGLPEDLRPAGRRLDGGGRASAARSARRWAWALYHTFFYIVVPIMAGGVGEGAIPLSIGYAADHAPAAGRPVRPGAAAGDAGQPDGDHPGRARSTASASATRA